MKELHFAAQYNYFIADMKIFPLEAIIDRWKVLIKGQENTPFENKWWYINVTFPDLYPIIPPIFRFISIPYHLNISSDGRICHNIIGKGYSSEKHVIEIIQEIKKLFLSQNLDTPIQTDAYLTFLTDPREYERRQKLSAERNAEDDYNQYIKDLHIADIQEIEDECI